MKAASDNCRQILATGSFSFWYEADLWYDNTRQLALLPIDSVQLSEDDSRGIKANGGCTLVWQDDFARSVMPVNIGDLFAPFGSELALYAVVSAGDFRERVPMGWMQIVDVPTMRDSTMFFSTGVQPGPTNRVNIATNPNFQTNTTGWVAEAGATITRDTSAPISGSGSGLLTCGVAGAGDTYTLAAVNAGDTITFSVDLQTLGPLTGTPRIYLNVPGAGGSYVYLPTNIPGVTRYSITSTATAAGNAICAIFTGTTVGNAVRFDNVLIEKSAQALPYFDGSTPANGSYVYAWDGPRNASTSREQFRGAPTGTRITTGTTLELKLQDRFIQIQRDEFDVPTAPAQLASVWAEIGALTGMKLIRSMPDAPITRSVVYQNDRLQALLDLADLLGGVPYAAPDGTLTMRPKVWPSPVDSLRAGNGGTLVDIQKGMSADQVYNKVAFRGQGDAQDKILAYSEVTNGPLRVRNTDGTRSPAHRRPTFRSNQFVNTSAQAQAYTDTELARVSTLNATSWPIEEVWNPLRELGDVITVIDEHDNAVLARVTGIERSQSPTQKVTVARG